MQNTNLEIITPAAVQPKPSPRSRTRSRQLFTNLMPLFFLIALIAGFALSSNAFLSQTNVMNILRQSAILLIVACGATFIIVQGSIDLSVGSIVTLSGIAAAIAVRDYHLGVWAVPIAVLVGLVAGTLNGCLFAYGKVPSFLVTLGALFAIDGAALLLSKGQAVQIMERGYSQIASGTLIGNLPNIALWSFIVLLFSMLIARYTRFGRYMYAIGGGERVARLSGVPVSRYKLFAFMFSGALAGLAGAMMSARLQAGSPRMGEGLLLDSIAAVVIGGTALTGGIGGPHRTILGVLIIGILGNGLNINAVDPYLQIIIKGTIVVAAVFVTIDRAKIQIMK